MAKLSAHGQEFARYFSMRRRALLAFFPDGVTLIRRPFHGWKVYSRTKPGVDLAAWKADKLAKIAALPRWMRECRSLPSMASLERMAAGDDCETVSGDSIEPDGTGADGAPSWLRALGMI